MQSLSVGGRGSAIIDWKNVSTLANALQKIVTTYYHVRSAIVQRVKGGAHTHGVNLPQHVCTSL